QVRSIASNLKQLGIGPGDRIILIGENHPNWALAYLGTLFVGAVIVPLDPHGEVETITNFLEDSEAKIAFIDADQAERFARIAQRIGHVKTVIWGGGNSADGEDVDFDDWLSAVDDAAKFPVPVSNDDTAVLIYTSGTTGK